VSMHPDLATAVEAVLTEHPELGEEFKKRFRKLVDNVVTAGRVRDPDVREVLDLVPLPAAGEI
jgi:hypothetical protein